MTYRLLACDLDGTLLTRQKSISPRTLQALNAAARGGCQIVVATGRSFRVARYFCQGLVLNAPQITYNGAVIYDPRQDAVLSQYLLPHAYTAPGIDFFREARVPVAYFTPERVYLDETMPRPHTWMPGAPELINLVADIHQYAGLPCIKIVGHGDALTIAALRPRAVEQFGDALYVTQTATELLELLHPEVSKGAALRRIAHMLEIKREEIIAFGDSHNDLDMLEFAGLGVAMGNASAEIKEIADQVTLGNEEDGIAVALERLAAV